MYGRSWINFFIVIILSIIFVELIVCLLLITFKASFNLLSLSFFLFAFFFHLNKYFLKFKLSFLLLRSDIILILSVNFTFFFGFFFNIFSKTFSPANFLIFSLILFKAWNCFALLIILKTLLFLFSIFKFSFAFISLFFFNILILNLSWINLAEVLYLIDKDLWSQSLKINESLLFFFFSIFSISFFNKEFFFLILFKFSFAKLFLIKLWILIVEAISLSSFAFDCHSFNLFFNKELIVSSFLFIVFFNNSFFLLLSELFFILLNSCLFIYNSKLSNPSFINCFFFKYLINFIFAYFWIVLAFSLFFTFCAWILNLISIIFLKEFIISSFFLIILFNNSFLFIILFLSFIRNIFFTNITIFLAEFFFFSS